MDEWDQLLEGIGKSLRGRPAKEISVGAIRPLEAEDLVIGESVRRTVTLPTSTPPELLKLRTRHHLIAQLLAIGMKPKDVALKTGYSVSRISILQLDPAFKELLANYTSEQENLTVDVKERLRHLSMDSIDVIQQRFDENPEQFTNKELFDLAELTLDRTGHGKTATVQHEYGISQETAALFKQNRTRPLVANLLEGELIDSSAGISVSDAPGAYPSSAGDGPTGGELFDEQPAQQLDLFEGEDKTAGGAAESAIAVPAASSDPEGPIHSGAALGSDIPEEVYADVRATNVVQLQRPPIRSTYPA